MINQEFKAMLQRKSAMRELNEYAGIRGKEIGIENVYDFSLGNPSVPVPDQYTDAVINLYQNQDSATLHGYTLSLGVTETRKMVAESLNRRFGMNYGLQHIFMTTGAAGALAHAFRAVTKPGDEVITFAPYYPEYVPYTKGAGLQLKVVSAKTDDFQIAFEELEELLTEHVTAILLNSPSNPTGVIYSAETLKKLADLMERKQEEYGHEIFLISDEPYREILFDGKDFPYPSHYYENTLSCYSFSKSVSLAGERIGYVAVHPQAKEADLLTAIMGQISRGIGHNCPASTSQLAIQSILEETSDLSVYEKNMNLLYDKLIELGFEIVRPSGTFYIFPKALEEDAVAFCEKAKAYDLLLVPSDTFGIKGYFRVAYCVDTEKVERSLPVFEKFVKEVYGLPK